MRRVPKSVQSNRPEKKLRKRGLVGWLKSKVGHATTETVIMIPVFVAIWGGIWYTHGRYRKAINMAQFTRAHTWQHAYEGCEGGPPGGGTSFSDRADNRDGFMENAIGYLLVIIPGFNFDEIEGRRTTSIERPTVLGEGNVSMGHNLVVLCNEIPQRDTSLFEAAWGVFF
jgi:hypothetical protein